MSKLYLLLKKQKIDNPKNQSRSVASNKNKILMISSPKVPHLIKNENVKKY